MTTGISAHDRADHDQDGARPGARARRTSRCPGHIFPLRAKRRRRAGARGTDRGLGRPGTAGRLYPAGVICEIMNDDGTMARMPQLESVAGQFGLGIVSVAQLIEYRRRHEKLVARVEELDEANTRANGSASVSRGRRQPADRLRRLPHRRLREHAQPRAARRAGDGRHQRPRPGARARALRVPHRRRLRLHCAAIAASNCTKRCA